MRIAIEFVSGEEHFKKLIDQICFRK
jgi:hypothetical protein